MILLRKFSAWAVSLTSSNVLKVSVCVDRPEVLANIEPSTFGVYIISTNVVGKMMMKLTQSKN